VLLLGPDRPEIRAPGVETIWLPLVRAVPVRGSSLRALEAARSGRVDTVAFTSPRAPRLLREEAESTGTLSKLLSALSSLEAWSVGPSTAEAARRWLGIESRVPREYRGRALAREIAESGARGVLGLRGSRALPDLGEMLSASGVRYKEVTVYMLEPVHRSEALERALRGVDVVLLTSPFIARLFVEAVRRLPEGLRLAAIGPTTAGEMERLGLRPACVPSRYVLGEALECAASLARR